ncbi:glycosyltransferase family 2 protein, partial [bacterium]|nr:glycosyltransferase family 2 protein [bacterium]
MTSNTHPAIVVVGYNRPDSLQRLLDSLNLANYQFDNIDLVISLDFCSGSLGDSTQNVAASFNWQHGKKRVILQAENIGLRNHVLACGDLSESYGAIILLEDDLSVGPDFYHFAKTALDFSDRQQSIGGVSLYNHKTNFLNQFPFEPVYDGYDNYYLQIASSWGQAWTHTQWISFRTWYGEIEKSEQEGLP